MQIRFDSKIFCFKAQFGILTDVKLIFAKRWLVIGLIYFKKKMSIFVIRPKDTQSIN